MNLTETEQVTNAETMRHILTVRALLMECVRELTERAIKHDQSKLGKPEVDTFTKYTSVLAGLTYGSEEYKQCLAEMKPALDNHYACNAHHPEHHKDGFMGMNLIDLLEMVIDWKAATLRHKNGDIRNSLEINTKRYDIPEPIRRILENTLPMVETMAATARVDVSYPHIDNKDLVK
ncbi:MAG: hypothetical protein KBD37_10305 [Burkholderiales bacterium]|nr:hypothetical protein [Burkholderiales bacterium]